MRGRSKRHPVLETAVFAAALLLAAFIGRELWQRRAPAPPAEPEGMQPVALRPDRPALPSASEPKRTETAVTGVPPIKLTRVQRRKPTAPVVPAPK